jgi:hypothetical protein
MPEGTVFHECWNCGVRFWLTSRQDECRRQDKRAFYCPNGHPSSYTESEADKVRAELAKVRLERDRLKQNEAWLEDRIAASRKEAERLRKRAAAGVCPCCNRSFANLKRHMSGKHAGYVAEPVQEAAA